MTDALLNLVKTNGVVVRSSKSRCMKTKRCEVYRKEKKYQRSGKGQKEYPIGLTVPEYKI